MKDNISVMCSDCGNNFSLSYSAYNAAKRQGRKFFCKECMKKVRSQQMKERNKSMTPEQRKAFYSRVSDIQKKRWENMNDTDRENRLNRLNTGNKNWQENKTKEDTERISKAHSESNIRRWSNLTDEQKAEISNNAKERWNNLSEEEKTQHSQHSKDMWTNMSDDEYQHIVSLMSKNKRKWWQNSSPEVIHDICDRIGKSVSEYWSNLSDEDKWLFSQMQKDIWMSLSDEEKQSRSLSITESMKNWWKDAPDELKIQRAKQLADGRKGWLNSLTPLQLFEQSQKRSTISKERWANMTDDERKEAIYKSLHANGKNNFHKKFESTFSSSHLAINYYFKDEVIINNNNVMHSWDYGIYEKSTNKLVMVVDLDGQFYHADNCDYDGIHSKEEYDEKRSLSVPSDSNIKICIIQEFKFKQCFENMIKMLMKKYDEYVDHMFKQFRSIPFPFPKYSNKELIKSYGQLLKLTSSEYLNINTNTRVGDHLINHFHSSIWLAHRAGCISPYNAWYNDDLLKQCIRNRVIYQTYLNPNKILQGFNVSKIAQKVSVFSAGRAKLIISKYLNEYDTIFDPFSGFSGRMLGTISLGKQYIGQDISSIHINESIKMIEFLNEFIGNINAIMTNVDVLQSYGEYPCLFTCPPYSDKEQWENVPVDTRSCDDWIDICLSHFKCNRYVFVVDTTEKYKDYIVDEIINKSHMNTNKEYVIVI